MTSNLTRVFGIVVHGVEVDGHTGCAHYRSNLDVIAIKHPCCNQWFACIECHSEIADHPALVWPKESFHERAILCGKCGARHSIFEYLADSTACPRCKAPYNPGCKLHHHLYFEQ